MVRAKGARHQNNFHMIPFYKNCDMVTGVKIVVVGKGGTRGEDNVLERLKCLSLGLRVVTSVVTCVNSHQAA